MLAVTAASAAVVRPNGNAADVGPSSVQPASDAVRVAHCVAGGVRGFPDPQMAARLARFVRLLSHADNPDVFMYLSNSTSSITSSTNQSGINANIYTPQQLAQAIDMLRPLAVEFLSTEPPVAHHVTTGCSAASGRGPVCASGSRGDERVCKVLAPRHRAPSRRDGCPRQSGGRSEDVGA